MLKVTTRGDIRIVRINLIFLLRKGRFAINDDNDDDDGLGPS